MLKNHHINKKISITTRSKHNKNWKAQQLINTSKDYSFDEFLINWLDEKTDDEATNFYKEIIFLVMHNKTIKGLIAQLDMETSTFYKHYKIAKQILKHDYTTSADNNIFFNSSLV